MNRVISIALIVVFAVVATTHLVFAFLRIVRKRSGYSAVPVLNGILGTIGVLAYPDAQVSSLWWIPFLLDWGCVPLLVETFVSRFPRRPRIGVDVSDAERVGWRWAKVTAALCAVAIAAIVAERVGIAPCGLGLLATLGSIVLLLAHVSSLPFRLPRGWRSAAVSILLCAAVFPISGLLSRWAIRARFYLHEDGYEAVATAIRDGTHPVSLGPDERVLGLRVHATTFPSQPGHDPSVQRSPNARVVTVVHFMVISHGFAGHVGYARAFDARSNEILRGGHGFESWWRHSSPLGDGWFVVRD